MPSKKKSGFVPSGPSRAALAEREKRDFLQKRENDVQMLKDEWREEFGDDWDGIVTKKFTSISVEYLVKTDDELFVPGEIGMCSYTLKDGIGGRKMHAFIRPKSIPLGYTADAKMHSDQRHKMPYGGVKNGVDDYDLIMSEIYLSVQPKWGAATAFCMAEEYKQVNSALRYLNDDRCHNIRLLCIEDLLHALCEWQADRSLHRHEILDEIDDIFSRTVHDFAPSIRCSFHDDPPDVDIEHCSIAIVHRNWYHTSDYLCASYKIKPTAKHLPSTSNTFQTIQVHVVDKQPVVENVAGFVNPQMMPTVGTSAVAPSSSFQIPVSMSSRAPVAQFDERESSEYRPINVEFGEYGVVQRTVQRPLPVSFYRVEEDNHDVESLYPTVSQTYHNAAFLSAPVLQPDISVYDQYCDQEYRISADARQQYTDQIPPLAHELPPDLIPHTWLPNNAGFRTRFIPVDAAPLTRSRGPNVGKRFFRHGVSA